MSRKLYECRFAPCAATWRDAIRVGQLVRSRGESVYEAFAPGAFSGWGSSGIPVVLDHDMKRRAGTVTVVAAHKDWHIASFVLDGPYAARAAEFIERSGTVSPGFYEVDKDPILAVPVTSAHNGTHWHTRARLDEISILPPGAIGWYAGAKVTRSTELKERPAERPARRELLVRNGIREIGRHHEGTDLVIDMSDGSAVIYHGAART